MKDIDLIKVIDRACDEFPRNSGAVVSRVGPFDLFTNPDPAGWPYYARPLGDAFTFADADVAAVRAAQRERGVPEAIEWIDEMLPALSGVVERNGMPVHRAPLLVLDPDALLTSTEVPGATLGLLDPDAEEFAADLMCSRAVAEIAFGPRDGTDERAGDQAAATAVAAAESAARRLRTPAFGEIVARRRDHGIVGRGALQCAGGVAEIVGVATLPAFRGAGIGSAVAVALAREALRRGSRVVFLSAASIPAARIYERVGFRHVATACVAEARIG